MSDVNQEVDGSFLEKIRESRKEDPVRKRIQKLLPKNLEEVEEFGKESKYPPGIPVLETDEKLMKITGQTSGDRLSTSNRNVRSSSIEPDEETLTAENKYVLVKCDFQGDRYRRPCTGLIIAKSGQKTGRCPKCGRRRRLKDAVFLYQSDDRERIRKKMGDIKRRGGLYK